jgi:hypothetical protein
MSAKKWKDLFLSSGVPLEYSVAQIFEELGSWRVEEFSYERKNEDGASQIFSVDVHSAYNSRKHDVRLDILAECKYRYDGTKWIFTPSETHHHEAMWGVDFSPLFLALDECSVDRKVDRDFLGRFGQDYPLCKNGIEILPEDTNPKTIEQAIRQLRYAVVAMGLRRIDHQRYILSIREPSPIFVIVPVIVTTAELWRLKPGTTVENVRRAESIDEVAHHHDAVVLWKKPDESDVKQATSAFRNNFTDADLEKLRTLVKEQFPDGLTQFMNYLANRPSLFLVAQYSTLRSTVKSLYELFAQDSLIQLKQRETMR